jgi:hypothetical protein
MTRMNGLLPLRDAQDETIRRLNIAAGNALKLLLETKHIYQKVEIEANEVCSEVQGLTEKDHHPFLVRWRSDFLAEPMLIASTEQLREVPRTGGLPKIVLTLLLYNVKLFCSRCESSEAFAPVWYTELTNEIAKHSSQLRITPGALKGWQIFALMYQCQRCKAAPESFLVKRDRWNLLLHGRSPMEEVDVPKYIPKKESWLYRDALIAWHGGKTLAAFFYLRSFIEQFARRVTRVTGKVTGDKIMDAYAQTLPASQRDQMPSLREFYDRLSEPIHEAREDEELFKEARVAVEKHFDIRRVFNIPDRKG